jgi:predicted nucleic acid-binding Zn ribbon protein
MSLKSLHSVLGSLETQYQSREQRQLQRILQCWAEVVGPVVAAQAQPTSIQRGVLRVATSSSAWAQNLVFERQRILEKLNAKISSCLSDIRFSTAQWQNPVTAINAGSEQQAQLWQQHPSRLIQPLSSTRTDTGAEVPLPVDSTQAFQNWARAVRSRSQDLPLCPHCHCPTPPGELERWQICALCAAKTW